MNGGAYALDAPVGRTLADVLRHDLGYTGTHLGCEHGICGACTVLVDGAPTRACLMFGVQADDCGLTGTHVGCEHGVCGACTVLLDGVPVRSCLMFAVSAVDHELTTVEGLTNEDGSLGPVQQAFAECHGLQCGFCTPGFLTTITAGLRENPEPTHEEARDMIAGNLCRCTGYQNIVKAVERAAELQVTTTAARPPHPPTPTGGQVPVEDRTDDAATTGLGG